jgi:hypothetical protein
MGLALERGTTSYEEKEHEEKMKRKAVIKIQNCREIES